MRQRTGAGLFKESTRTGLMRLDRRPSTARRCGRMDNGPGRELPKGADMADETVYCVDCGNVYVWDMERDCPACHVANLLSEVMD